VGDPIQPDRTEGASHPARSWLRACVSGWVPLLEFKMARDVLPIEDDFACWWIPEPQFSIDCLSRCIVRLAEFFQTKAGLR
jgi:hypothetical protein